MRLECRYSQDEVEQALLDLHQKLFGNPPDGMKWDVSLDAYAGGRVTSIEDESKTAPVKE